MGDMNCLGTVVCSVVVCVRDSVQKVDENFLFVLFGTCSKSCFFSAYCTLLKI